MASGSGTAANASASSSGDAAGGGPWPVAVGRAPSMPSQASRSSASDADKDDERDGEALLGQRRRIDRHRDVLVEDCFRKVNDLMMGEVRGLSDQISIIAGRLRDDLLVDLEKHCAYYGCDRDPYSEAGGTGDMPDRFSAPMPPSPPGAAPTTLDLPKPPTIPIPRSPQSPKSRPPRMAPPPVPRDASPPKPTLAPPAGRQHSKVSENDPTPKSNGVETAFHRFASGQKHHRPQKRPSLTKKGNQMKLEVSQKQEAFASEKPTRRQSVSSDDSAKSAESEQFVGRPNRKSGRVSVKEERRKSAVRPVFADEQQMKEQVRAAVLKKSYNIRELYHEKGFCPTIARSNIFDVVTLSVISFNSIWIAIDIDLNDAPTLFQAEPVFQVAENLFCLYFTFEWVIRFASFKSKMRGFRDAWFMFDSILVSVMVTETWILTLVLMFVGSSSSPSSPEGGRNPFANTSLLKVVRLLRLSRMARMVRLLRAFPELMILIKGITVAARSVFFTLVLLVVIIYVFAVMFRQLAGDASEEFERDWFPGVIASMRALLLDGILPDQATIMSVCIDNGFLTGIGIMVFVLLASLTVMNMLVGILCEVVSVVSQVEKEQLQVNYVRNKLLDMYQALGMDDGSEEPSLTEDEFRTFLMDPTCIKAIQEVGVDAVGLVDLGSFLFSSSEDGKIAFHDLLDIVLQLRGSNTCTVKEIVDLRKYLYNEMNQVKELLQELFDADDTEKEEEDGTEDGASLRPLLDAAADVPPPPPRLNFPPLPPLPHCSTEDDHPRSGRSEATDIGRIRYSINSGESKS